MKLFLLAVTMVLHLTACSFYGYSPTVEVAGEQYLSQGATHSLLKKWKKNGYQSTDKLKVSFTSKHKIAPKFENLISGKTISMFATRKGDFGLPVAIEAQKHSFSVITKNAYLSQLYTGSLIAKKTAPNSYQLTLYDPLNTPKVKGASLRVQEKILMDHVIDKPGNLGLKFKGLLNPERYNYTKGIYLTEPYDKNKIPLVMIHGILSTPETFIDMAERIQQDPELHKKYQIWFYYYPTGSPWLTSAADFRDTLNRLTKKLDPKNRYRNMRKMVIIAHSMGGLITRLSLSEPSNKISQAYLNGNDPLKLGNADFAKSLDRFSHFKPLTQPAKVIFIATPHKGSLLAGGPMPWAARKVISIPKYILTTTSKLLIDSNDSIPPHTKKLLHRGETAVDQLKPSHPAIKTLNTMKMRKGIEVHSIIADIGLPIGVRFYTDGVVAYKNAHIPFAKTETIVPSNHDTSDEDETIDAVIRILR